MQRWISNIRDLVLLRIFYGKKAKLQCLSEGRQNSTKRKQIQLHSIPDERGMLVTDHRVIVAMKVKDFTDQFNVDQSLASYSFVPYFLLVEIFLVLTC